MESSRRIVVIMIILTAHASLLGGQGSDPVWLSSEKKEMIQCDLKAKATVSLDGTGDHRTITEALAAVPENNVSPYVIHVKEGVYKENVKVSKKHVVMFGDGSHKTVVVGNMSRVDFPDLATFETATFSVLRDNFVVKDMMFRNVAGPEKHQAVAFHSKSSFSVMYRCRFEGFQDTLYAHSGHQFFLECDIVGTVDFIFGDATAVFQNCSIMPRQPLPGQVVTVTAQAAIDRESNTGFSITHSKIMPYDDGDFRVYLGRPWRSYARVIVMYTELSQLVDPRGWLAWNSSTDPPPPTVTLGEYQNYGPGSDVTKRVNWIGYTPVMTDEEAKKFTVDEFLNQKGWLQQTCVPSNGSNQSQYDVMLHRFLSCYICVLLLTKQNMYV